MSKERNTSLLRRLLNRDGVKLWLEPYTLENSSIGNYTQDFISKYSVETKLQPTDVKDILEQLRNNALRKLSSNKKYLDSGIATLKLKIGQKQCIITDLSILSLETYLSVSGSDLKEKVSSLCHLSSSSLKLICNGVIINDEETLEAQKIKNNSTLLVLILDHSKEFSVKEEQALRQLKEVQHIKKDVKLLLNSKNDYSKLEFADQNGKVISIPEEQKQALGFAMTLNEKSRTFLKKKDYSNALIYLLEADKEFMNVKWDFINMTDNYPILCLDIVWCYLCLSSVSDLHDAEKRLATCEKYLYQSYGQNCDRLMSIKGSSGCEAALFARLHLLQGVLAFHKNSLKEAENFLSRAGNEISSLKVDDNKLSEIVALGYTAKEARLSLRHCNGNVTLAVSYIINKKEERMRIVKEETEERRKRRKAKKLGKTVNGDAVSLECYKSMLNMGFSSKSAICALQKANNSVSLAVDLLNENPNLAADQNKAPENLEEMVANLCDMFGLNYDAAMSALENNNMDFEFVKNLLGASTSSNTEKDVQSDDESILRTEEAVSRLSSGIDFDEEDYLDLGLEEETEYLHYYLALLNNVNKQ